MSWIFGLGGNAQPPPPKAPNDSQTSSNKNERYSFDSAALDKAAKAAETLEKSRFAKEAYELTREQDISQKLEENNNIKEQQAYFMQMELQQLRAQEEERRQTMEEDFKKQKSRADYQDMLARKRQEDQMSQQRRLLEESLRKQEEAMQKQEASRRSALEYQAQLEHKNAMKRVEAEMNVRAQVERDNRDVRLDQIHAQAQEQRETVLQSIKALSSMFGAGFSTLVSDWDKVGRVVAGLTLLAGGVYATKYGLGTVARMVEARIGKPSLVRQTSRLNVVDLMRHPIQTVKQRRQKPSDPLQGMVLHPSVEARLREISIATRHNRLNNGYYRNVLMCGPPGTGKTMFARSLALHSGMDYAIMTGGDVAPMGQAGVTAVHRVFDWASTSRRGLLLFIDEADAFLRKRSQEQISENVRATLNAFLFRTGEQSKKFMLVLASNQPDQFDWAINDRLDEIVEFPLPTEAERERLFRHYFDMFVLQPSLDKKHRIFVEKDVDYALQCAEFARITPGLSGREISKIAIAWQTSAYASSNGILTVAMMHEKVLDAVMAHEKKEKWRKSRQSAGYLERSSASSSDKDQDSALFTKIHVNC